MFSGNNGELLHNTDFAVAKPYHEGLAAIIRNGEKRWEYIDRNGDTAFPGKFKTAGSFSHGYAPVKDIYDRTYYIDNTGQPAFGGLLFDDIKEINEDGYALIESRVVVEIWDDEIRDYWITTAYRYILIIIKE